MEFKSIADVLDFAISKEKAAKQFYLDLSEKVTDLVSKTVFKSIVRQEQKHIEMLELEKMKAGYTVGSSSKSDKECEFMWTESLELDDESRNMDFKDAILLAIQKERASFQLYAQLVGMTSDLTFRQMLLELAEEEMRHVLQFEREYETITQHHKE